MEKRLVLAIALSLLVLLSWSALVPKPQLIENKEVVTNKSQVALPSQEPSLAVISAVAISPTENVIKDTVKFTQDGREIIFDPARGSIVNVVFKDGVEHSLALKIGFLTDSNFSFQQHTVNKDGISFIYEDQNKRIIKTFNIPKDSYVIGLDIQMYNLSSLPLVFNPQLVLGRLDLSAQNKQARFQDAFLGTKEKTIHLSVGKDFNSPDVKFIGLRDQYFCTIVEPAIMANRAYIKRLTPQESEVGLLMGEVTLKPGAQIGHSFRIYLGPQDLKTINNANPEWSSIIYFGTFDFIAQLLLQLLGFFYSLVHNWGLAIIILSVSVYLLLFPLSMKQMRSMKEMQILQPKIEALRKELKDNPQKLNKEIMELYKEHKVNPLGGCLPLLLQMPIFFALYQALIRSVSLRGAHFLWIKDLSSPDKAFIFKNSIPFFGNQVNILPILMAIGMFVQQKISMAKATGEAAQQQQMMSIIMPIMFGVIFYQMPSGLVLYWFMNSLLMLCYQFRVNIQK
jgi:YidC/Oxa1 family membrane protein insertase